MAEALGGTEPRPRGSRRLGILVGAMVLFLVAAVFGAQWMSTELLATTYQRRLDELARTRQLERRERVTIPAELGEWLEGIAVEVRDDGSPTVEELERLGASVLEAWARERQGLPVEDPDATDIELSFAALLDDPILEPFRTGSAIASEFPGLDALSSLVEALTRRAKATWPEDPRGAAEDLRRALVAARIADNGNGMTYLMSLGLADETLATLHLLEKVGTDWSTLSNVLDTPLAAAADRARLVPSLVAAWRFELGPDDHRKGARGNALAVFERGETYVRGLALLDALEATLAATKIPCDAPDAPERRSEDGYLAIEDPYRESWIRGLLTAEGYGHASLRGLVLARVALALAAHHQETGRWPSTLDELDDRFEDGVPSDPCTGRPFVYVDGPDAVELKVEHLPRIGHPALGIVTTYGSRIAHYRALRGWGWPKR